MYYIDWYKFVNSLEKINRRNVYLKKIFSHQGKICFFTAVPYYILTRGSEKIKIQCHTIFLNY